METPTEAEHLEAIEAELSTQGVSGLSMLFVAVNKRLGTRYRVTLAKRSLEQLTKAKRALLLGKEHVAYLPAKPTTEQLAESLRKAFFYGKRSAE